MHYDLQPHYCILYSLIRYEYRRDFRFDNVGYAMLTLFEVMTTEGWLDVRDLFGDSERHNLV